MSASTPPERERRSPRALRLLGEHLPEAIVLIALCSLLGINYYQLQSLRTSLRDMNNITEPSTRAASDLQLALSREAASVRAFLLTGNAEYGTEFERARADRRDALQQLTLTSDAVEGVDDVLAEAEAKLSVADGWLNGLFGGSITRAEYLAEFPSQHRRFTSVAASAATLHRRLRAQATVDRQRIDRTQRLATRLELAGVILAIVAGAAVTWLKRRERTARIASDAAQADAELRRAQLENMTTRWTRLIRGFSHDLKNPLNAAEGHLFMLERGMMSPLSPAQMQAVAQCRHAVQAAIALTVDLVDLARAETADIDVRRVEMNLCDVVASVIDDYRAQAAAKGLAVVTNLPPVPELIQSDRARVSQILGNLVSNAVKYTDAGTITVAVRRGMNAAGEHCVAVDVGDTGPGIPQEHQRRIFGEFEQLDPSEPRGTGIGLAISERLANTLGGTITLHSEEGKGSTFTLWLPLTGSQ